MKSRKRPGVEYPLGENLSKSLKSKTGMRYEEITLQKLRRGDVDSDDLSINADTLRIQAHAAAEAGYHQLAANFTRAAELVRIPNKRLLEIYEALRPHHSSMAELRAISKELVAKYHAPATSRFVLEASQAYRHSRLLRSLKAR